MDRLRRHGDKMRSAYICSVLVVLFFTIVWASVTAMPIEGRDPQLSIIHSCTAPGQYWPTENWRNSTPEEQGMDSRQFDAMDSYIQDSEALIDSIILVRHGYVVFETYRDCSPELPHPVCSVTKSITSILMGIALDKGLIKNVSQRVVDFFPNRTIGNLDSRKLRMTLWHLLTMTTGFAWDEWSLPYQDPLNSESGLEASKDPVQYVLDTPMAYEPGEKWAYCSGGSFLLGQIIAQASGDAVEDFARKFLFDPIGVGYVYWTRLSGGYPHTGAGLFMTPRDAARVGYLMLHNGTWNGSQIVSADWVAESTNTTIGKGFSTYVYPFLGYGYQWWTFPDSGFYCASGYEGQYIFVVPRLDLVAVFAASTPENAYDPTVELMNYFIVPSVVSEDPLPPRSQPYSGRADPDVVVILCVGIVGVAVLGDAYLVLKSKKK